MKDLDQDTLAVMNAFISAAGDVLRIALADLGSDSTGALGQVRSLLAAGGLMAVTARAGACIELAQVQVQITDPAGTVHTVLLVELQDSATAPH